MNSVILSLKLILIKILRLTVKRYNLYMLLFPGKKNVERKKGKRKKAQFKRKICFFHCDRKKRKKERKEDRQEAKKRKQRKKFFNYLKNDFKRKTERKNKNNEGLF